MQKHTFKAQKRTVTGKKVKNLRLENLLPGNIYGKNVDSQAVQVNLKEFQKLFAEVGETGLVDLDLEGTISPVLIRHLQLSPVTDLPIHIDFYQVNLKEKITTNVPVEVVGEPEAVASKIGVLLTLVDEVEVEALPADLPENLPLDVSKLKEIDEELKVKDLKYDKEKIEMKSDPEQTIVKIGALITEEMKKEAEAEEAAKVAAAAEGAPGAEGAKSEEMKEEKKEEKPAESKKPEEKKEEKKE